MHGNFDEHGDEVSEGEKPKRQQILQVPVSEPPEDVPRRQRNLRQRRRRVLANLLCQQQDFNGDGRTNTVRVPALERPDRVPVERTFLRGR